jgi:flavin-binding protein dodecin
VVTSSRRGAEHGGERLSRHRAGRGEQPAWDQAARNAVETAAKTVRELRVAEIVRSDLTIENGQVKNFRVRLSISFKYEASE